MDHDAKVYEALVNALIRALNADEPNPKIVECAVKFVQSRDISTMPGTHQGEEELKASLPFRTKTG